MADLVFQLFDKSTSPPTIAPIRLVDNGDGTYSLRTSGAGGTAPAPALGTYTERSTTITAGGTAQVGMAALATRKAWFLQNISAGDLWFSFVETAVIDGAGSAKLSPGASAFSSGGFVSSQALSIIGATTGQKFTLWEA